MPNGHVPADPVVLTKEAMALGEAARGVLLANTPGAARTPTGDRLAVHRLSGWVKVAALSRVGLTPSGDPPDDAEVRFEMLIERETGLPTQFVFHGVPPAHPPLAVLHVFEYNSLATSSVPEPENIFSPDADNGSAEVESATATPAAVSPAELPPPIVPAGQPDAEDAPASVEDSSRSEIYIEVAEGRDAGWTRYVVPTEGYSIEAPGSWMVSSGREGTEESAGRLDGVHGVDSEEGSRWSIYRMAARGSLLGLGQLRVESILADPSTEPGSLDFSTEDLPVGTVVRIEYRAGSGPDRWVCEYVVVRGTPGLSSNLGYSIELSADSPGGKAELERIAASFGLLGVGQ